MTAGDNPHRIGSEATPARLCGTAPIPASSGTTTRYRLHRGGDRQANSAIHPVLVNRLPWHPATRTYVQRRTAEGKIKKEIIRCLKRAVVREIYTALRADLAPKNRRSTNRSLAMHRSIHSQPRAARGHGSGKAHALAVATFGERSG